MAKSRDGESRIDDRAQRLAEALRANLRKRKAQLRNRREEDAASREARPPTKNE